MNEDYSFTTLSVKVLPSSNLTFIKYCPVERLCRFHFPIHCFAYAQDSLAGRRARFWRAACRVNIAGGAGRGRGWGSKCKGAPICEVTPESFLSNFRGSIQKRSSSSFCSHLLLRIYNGCQEQCHPSGNLY